MHKYVTTRPPIVPQFDVSFHEKLLKIVAIRGEIFNLKFTKYRVAAGLRPDPLGEQKRYPRPADLGGLLKGAYLVLRGGKGRGRKKRRGTVATYL